MKPSFFASLRRAWKQRRQMHETRHALEMLSTRELRDLGIHASEIVSVAREASGLAERQRTTRFVPYY